MNLPKLISTEIISLLKEKIGDSITLNQVTPVGGGSINEAYQLNTSAGSFFLKMKRGAPEDFFRCEAEGLKTLSHAGAQVPHLVAVTERFLIIEWIERGNWTPARMAELGRQLASIHLKENDRYGFKDDNYIGLLTQHNRWTDNWITFYKVERLQRQYDYALQHGRLSPSSQRAKRLACLIDRLEEWLPAKPHASLLHGDLWSGNILPAHDGRNLLIDPAVYIGHREVDLAFSEYFGGFSPDFYDGYEEVYPLEPEYIDRKPLYQLYYILVHLNLFGEAYGGAVDAVLNRYVG